MQEHGLMNKIIQKNQNGFTLIEVMTAMAIFAIGILGVAKMQIIAIEGNSNAGELTKASTIAQDKIEDLMSLDYNNKYFADKDGDGTNQDPDGNGDDEVGPDKNWGLNDTYIDSNNNDRYDSGETIISDYYFLETYGKYSTFWNIAVDKPIPRTKTIRVITTWDNKGISQDVVIDYIKFDEI